jgi:MFS family permease
MFVYVGAPGILVALLVLTIREPLRRDRAAATDALLKKASPLWATIRFVFQRWKTYIVLFLALSVLAIMAYGIGFWIPEFLRRTYHLSNEELGYYIRWRGIVNIVFGLVGVVSGGVLCDLARRRYSDGYVRVCLFGFFFMTIGYTSFALMPTPGLAVAMLIPASFGAAAPTAAGAAAIIAIAPPNMRAQITALYYFTLNLVGLFVGPTAVALMTDYYFEAEDQLRYSLAVVAFVAAAIGTVLLLVNLRHYRRSAAEAQAWAG